MANELLDFVMGLVRDPDAAARYAADPAQAIADAHLADVTSADVNNLIPMVSDSLSMAAPALGAETTVDSNVWTSGAATAAFDAFAPLSPVDISTQLPDLGVIDVLDVDVLEVDVPDVDVPYVVVPESLADLPQATNTFLADESVLLSDVDIDAPALWDQSVTDPQPPDPGHSTFDLFD